MKKWLTALAAIVMGAGMSTAAHAGAFTTIDCNPDMYNLTGRTANDFDILLGNFDPSNLAGVYTDPTLTRNPFPQYSVTDQGGGDVLVRYFGAEVENGKAVHVGIRVPYGVGNGFVKDQYWTYDNGSQVEILGRPVFRCNLLPTDYTDGDVTNSSGTDAFWVQRRALYQRPNTMLDDLLPDGALWNAASVIDLNPVLLGAGQTLDYTFSDSGDGAYIMGYDVWTNNGGQRGDLVQRVMQANNVVPEPATLSLVSVALMVMLRRKVRNRLASARQVSSALELARM